MGKLVRFGVSIDKTILDRFDKFINLRKYPTRSKAITDLITETLIKEDWSSGKETAGIISLVYDHHKHKISNEIIHVQHDYYKNIISSQHVHLDHNNCLEIVIVRGNSSDIKGLSNSLKAIKGVKYCSLSLATTGKNI